MKIVINFYLLILALSILIYFISQRRVNTKGFATKSKRLRLMQHRFFILNKLNF